MDVKIKTLIVQVAGLFAAFALALFVPAGTIAWPAGWTFMVMFFSFVSALSLWLLRHNPGLLKERMRGVIQPEQMAWDKALIIMINVMFFAWMIVMPLDAVRFGWSHMPVWLQAAGAAVLLCSFYIFFLVFRENSYLSPVIRIQEERGQTVVSTGPYHYVRHPMYSGAVLFIMGTSLLLGSWYGLLFGLMLVVMIAVRAVLEERTLQAELQGYEAYMAEVKYRLIPHIW
jgi:protein-S-isoprenylcysteine O-methyltransferase Ste14